MVAELIIIVRIICSVFQAGVRYCYKVLARKLFLAPMRFGEMFLGMKREISTLVYSASTGHYFSTDGRSDHAGFISKPFWIEKSDVNLKILSRNTKNGFYFSYHLNLANVTITPGDCCRANVKVRMRVF